MNPGESGMLRSAACALVSSQAALVSRDWVAPSMESWHEGKRTGAKLALEGYIYGNGDNDRGERAKNVRDEIRSWLRSYRKSFTAVAGKEAGK